MVSYMVQGGLYSQTGIFTKGTLCRIYFLVRGYFFHLMVISMKAASKTTSSTAPASNNGPTVIPTREISSKDPRSVGANTHSKTAHGTRENITTTASKDRENTNSQTEIYTPAAGRIIS